MEISGADGNIWKRIEHMSLQHPFLFSHWECGMVSCCLYFFFLSLFWIPRKAREEEGNGCRQEGFGVLLTWLPCVVWEGIWEKVAPTQGSWASGIWEMKG